MNSLLITFVVVIVAAFAFYRLGRKSHETKTLEQDVKTGQKANEILKNQRDNRIDSVDDADRMWTDREKD